MLRYPTALLYVICLLATFWPFQNLNAQLLNGPMLGYSEFREVAIWVQTEKAQQVYIAYTDTETKQTFKTTAITTEKAKAHTATLIADEVLPGKKYTYDIYVDGKKQAVKVKTEFSTQPLWRWRTDAPDFNFLIGSCAYTSEERFDRPGTPYGSDYSIYEQMAKEPANFMVWLGDNIYLREADWFTQTGIHHRYTHFRSLPETRDLWANMHHYAIWDDHDYGPNDADRSFIHKDKTAAAFENFWANPTYGLPGESGITTFFEHLDAHFFLLDNRTFRTPILANPQERFILGRAQADWLIEALKYSRAPFKFVCVGGQFLNSAAVYENHSVFEQERTYILQRIKAEHIKGVIFLDGDRHHSEISKYDDQDGLLIYDITCSPLTSKAVKEVKEQNQWLITESMINERNYAVLNISGPRKDRTLNITFKNTKGEPIYQYQIKQTEWAE